MSIFGITTTRLTEFMDLELEYEEELYLLENEEEAEDNKEKPK